MTVRQFRRIPKAATGAMAATGAGGVFLRPVKAMVITTPASCRQKKGEEAEDSCEDLGVTQLEESDIIRHHAPRRAAGVEPQAQGGVQVRQL